jgi:hypothetical protein
MTAGLAASTSAIAGGAPAPGNAAELSREHAEHERMLDTHLARMKAEIRLTAAQEAHWRRFEAVVRDAAKTHLDSMMEKLARSKVGEKPSPIEHARGIADEMAKSSTAVKTVADAAEPLFESLSAEQKRKFARRLQMLVERLPHAGMGFYPWGGDRIGAGD